MEDLFRAASAGGGIRVPEKGGDIDLGAAKTQASQLWEFLDELAERDPEAYRRFVMKQAREVEGAGKPHVVPEPGFCVKFTARQSVSVRTGGGEPLERKIFVNICSHQAVDRPLDRGGKPVGDDSCDTGGLSIPLVVSPLRRIEKTGARGYEAVDVLVHPWVAAQCEGTPGAAFRGDVIKLARSWVEQERGVALSETWAVMKAKYRGGSDRTGTRPVPYYVPEGQLRGGEGPSGEGGGVRAQRGPREAGGAGGAAADAGQAEAAQAGAADSEDAALTDAQRAVLRAMGASGPGMAGAAAATAGAAATGRGPAAPQDPGPDGGVASRVAPSAPPRVAPPLISVVDETDAAAGLPKPDFALEDSNGEMVLTVQLPGVASMSEIELEASEDALRLFVPGRFSLEQRLPRPIDADSVVAKFRRRRGVLVLRLR